MSKGQYLGFQHMDLCYTRWLDLLWRVPVHKYYTSFQATRVVGIVGNGMS